jgi:hypothetical protein
MAQGVTSQLERFDEAMDRGDVFEAARALGNITGQVAMAGEGVANLPKVAVAPAPALATAESVAFNAAGTVTITGGPASLVAGAALSSQMSGGEGAVTKEQGTRANVRVEERSGGTRAEPTSKTVDSPAEVRWRQALGEGPEIDAMHVTHMRGAGMASKPRHHVFPQEHRAFFERRGFSGERSIDSFTLELEESTHQAVHGGGNFKLGRRWTGEWNSRIMGELTRIESEVGRQLTFEEIMSVGEDLMARYGIDQPFVPYR